MFGRDRDDDWEEHHNHRHKWDWESPLSPDSQVLTMDIVGIILCVAGAVLVCSLLACCCRRRRGNGVVLIPPHPPGPNTAPAAALYPQQQYIPYPVVPVVTPYPCPAVGAHGAAPGPAVGAHAPPPVGPYPSAPAASDLYAPPPSYSQAVGMAAPQAPMHDHTHATPYNPHFKQ